MREETTRPAGSSPSGRPRGSKPPPPASRASFQVFHAAFAHSGCRPVPLVILDEANLGLQHVIPPVHARQARRSRGPRRLNEEPRRSGTALSRAEARSAGETQVPRRVQTGAPAARGTCSASDVCERSSARPIALGTPLGFRSRLENPAPGAGDQANRAPLISTRRLG